jgi:hypothetical protein
MNSKRNLIGAATLAAMMLPFLVLAQTPAKHVPAKATPPAPHTLTATAVVPNNSLVRKSPTKPTVVTAVAPKPLVGPTQKGIIFVGGKPSPGSKSALNPQPIPPGRGNPGDPVH